jgi:hypothetical protein
VTSDLLSVAKWIDVVLVVAVAPFVLLMGIPVLGYVAGAAAWILTRVAGHFIDRKALASDNPKNAAGLLLCAGLGRSWLLGLTILAVGLGGNRSDGLTAAVLVFIAFSVYLAGRVANRPERRSPAHS